MRVLLAVWFALLIALPSHALDSLEGTWNGQWIRDGSVLEVSMRFSKTEGGYAGTFDSEQLRVVGIPLRDIALDAPRVGWKIVGDTTTMEFMGDLKDGSIAGRFEERGAAGRFVLSRSTQAPPSLKREEISFANGPVTLAGTVLIPSGEGRHPGIVFLHGSGAEGRWASNYLAMRFVRQGFAALVFDKRGVGASTGDWRTSGFEELAADAAAAVQALRLRPYVIAERVGIHGHSQGGTIAPLAAALIRDPAFVIASAAGAGPMRDIEIYSIENSLPPQAMNVRDAAAASEYVRAIVAVAYDGEPRERLDAAWNAVRELPGIFKPPPPNDSYWIFSRKIASYDALAYWRGVSAPTLLVYGDADRRVPARLSAKRIADAYLGDSGKSIEVILFEGADHTFRLSPAQGRFSWPLTAPGYPERLLAWARDIVSPPPSK